MHLPLDASTTVLLRQSTAPVLLSPQSSQSPAPNPQPPTPNQTHTPPTPSNQTPQQLNHHCLASPINSACLTVPPSSQSPAPKPPTPNPQPPTKHTHRRLQPNTATTQPPTPPTTATTPPTSSTWRSGCASLRASASKRASPPPRPGSCCPSTPTSSSCFSLVRVRLWFSLVWWVGTCKRCFGDLHAVSSAPDTPQHLRPPLAQCAHPNLPRTHPQHCNP